MTTYAEIERRGGIRKASDIEIENDKIVGKDIYNRFVGSPKSIDLRNDLMPVRDQLDTYMCAAFAGACIREWQEFHDSKIKTYMSPEWIFHKKQVSNGLGMTIQNLMEILQNYGVIREDLWPFKQNAISNVEEINIDAMNFKILKYARCDTIESVKTTLSLCGPCVAGMYIYNGRSDENFWKPISENEKVTGGHTITIVGYTETNEFILRNSWGKKWGNNGYFNVPFSNFDKFFDIYCAYDDTTDKKYIESIKTKTKMTKCGCMIS